MGTSPVYGSQADVAAVYQDLPESASDAKAIMDKVGSDGKVTLPNGKKVDLRLYFEAAFEKFGMAFGGQTLSFFAGYPGVQLGTILKGLIATDQMVAVIGGIVENNNITLESIDPNAFHRQLFGAWTADRRVFSEARFYQSTNMPPTGNYRDLMNQLAFNAIGTDELRNPYKGKSPPLNIQLLLLLAQTGQIALLLMIFYKESNKMSNEMSLKLATLLYKQADMKRKIMEKIAKTGAAQDDPAVAAELQKSQMQMQAVNRVEEVTTSMLSELKESLKSFFQMMMAVQRTENDTMMAAARGG